STKLTVQVPFNHPVLAGGGAFYAVDVAPLRVAARDAQILVADRDTDLMALVGFGRGQVVALGDPWLYNEYIGRRGNRRLGESLFEYLLQPALPVAAPFDSSAVKPGSIAVETAADQITVTWPDEAGRTWRAEFSLRRDRGRNQPLITAISVNG